MKKVRCSLVAIALIANLSGLFIQGMGSGALANVAASRHVSSSSVSGKTSSHVTRPYWPCPVTEGDC